MNVRTEKAIKAVIAGKDKVHATVKIKKNGNHSITFFETEGDMGVLATFTLRSLVAKRYPRRKK